MGNSNFTPPGWVEAIVEKTREMAKTMEISTIAFIQCDRGVIAVPSPPMHDSGTDVRDLKDLFVSVVRRCAIELDASAVLVVSEAWMRVLDRANGATKENLNDTFKNMAPLRTYSDSFEAIAMTLETKKGSWMGTAKLEGKLGARTFGPLEFSGHPSMGRFSNFLPDKDASAYTNPEG